MTAPQGEVLLVDDVPAAQSAPVDPAYRNALNRQLGSSAAYTVIDIELANPFRSAADITATFGFFRSVIWYQDMNTARSAALPLAEDAIRTHLAAGGNVYVCSTILVGTSGAIATPGFLADVVGADSVRVNPKLGTTAFSIGNGSIIHPAAGAAYDSLRAVAISTNVDALVLRQAADAAFEARPIVLDSSQVEPWTIGVDRVPAGGADGSCSSPSRCATWAGRRPGPRPRRPTPTTPRRPFAGSWPASATERPPKPRSHRDSGGAPTAAIQPPDRGLRNWRKPLTDKGF